jgi:hypothetical protein
MRWPGKGGGANLGSGSWVRRGWWPRKVVAAGWAEGRRERRVGLGFG